jgi:hypothetical protein
MNVNMHPSTVHSLLIGVELSCLEIWSTTRTASWVKMREIWLLRCRILSRSSVFVQKIQVSLFLRLQNVHIYKNSVFLSLSTLILILFGTEHSGQACTNPDSSSEHSGLKSQFSLFWLGFSCFCSIPKTVPRQYPQIFPWPFLFTSLSIHI